MEETKESEWRVFLEKATYFLLSGFGLLAVMFLLCRWDSSFTVEYLRQFVEFSMSVLLSLIPLLFTVHEMTKFLYKGKTYVSLLHERIMSITLSTLLVIGLGSLTFVLALIPYQVFTPLRLRVLMLFNTLAFINLLIWVTLAVKEMIFKLKRHKSNQIELEDSGEKSV